jgi:hypothetical protein
MPDYADDQSSFDLEKWRADGRAYAAEHPNELRDFIARMDPGGSEPENALETEPPDDFGPISNAEQDQRDMLEPGLYERISERERAQGLTNAQVAWWESGCANEPDARPYPDEAEERELAPDGTLEALQRDWHNVAGKTAEYSRPGAIVDGQLIVEVDKGKSFGARDMARALDSLGREDVDRVAPRVVSSATIASADILSLPAAIPDICGPFAGCLTFTNSTFLAGLQQIQGMIQQIKMAETNLANLPTTLGNPQTFIATVTSAGQTVNQMTKADVAANAVVSAAQTNAAQAAKANADVARANGAQQNAKAGNEHLSAIDQTTQAQLDLAAQQQQQDGANRNAILNAFKPPAALTIPSIM